MTEYRKQPPRTFYRLDGEHVLRIINMESISQVDAGNNPFVRFDAKEKNTVEISEAEFNKEFDIAMERIKNMKI